MAAAVFFLWIRMFLMLELTKTFGPLIKIIYALIKDLFIFLGLYLIQLLAFTCMGLLVFNKIPEYQSFFGVFTLLVESSLGSWDMSLFSKSYPGLIRFGAASTQPTFYDSKGKKAIILGKAPDMFIKPAKPHLTFFYIGQIYMLLFLLL